MVLNQLKQIRDELKKSGDAYDAAFKNTALIAAEELVSREKQLKSDRQTSSCLNPVLDKQYFIANYGSLKNSKIAYQKIYGNQNYGRSWSDFIGLAKKLTLPKQQTLTLEERVTKLENFLSSLGYQL
ncbi:MAG TPA: hypothetical protein V6C71_23440 [Coleofasciculaceae cyanobacterium]|jgi:hypothetical protein